MVVVFFLWVPSNELGTTRNGDIGTNALVQVNQAMLAVAVQRRSVENFMTSSVCVFSFGFVWFGFVVYVKGGKPFYSCVCVVASKEVCIQRGGVCLLNQKRQCFAPAVMTVVVVFICSSDDNFLSPKKPFDGRLGWTVTKEEMVTS